MWHLQEGGKEGGSNAESQKVRDMIQFPPLCTCIMTFTHERGSIYLQDNAIWTKAAKIPPSIFLTSLNVFVFFAGLKKNQFLGGELFCITQSWIS